DVCARGLGTWIAGNSPEGTDIYRSGSGTSFATPLIAGVAALLLEIHRDWTPKQIRDALTKSANRSFKPDNNFGWGIVDAELAASWDQSKGKKGPPR
ncbi:MAG: S8 family serine peptidase, partial [Candidatus Aminicenantes bacterium]|nr:S8 family serine peptidase [Candidatus Aminicenantes bacterium]